MLHEVLLPDVSGNVALVSAAAHQQATDGAVVPHCGPAPTVPSRSWEEHGMRGVSTARRERFLLVVGEWLVGRDRGDRGSRREGS